MSLARETAWTTEEFLVWHLKQDARYELVDGAPVRMQAGARRGHFQITANVLNAFANALEDSPCEAFANDAALETFPNQIRYPDVVIDCGEGQDSDLKTASPKVVVEVLSPSTRIIDINAKAREYREVASLTTVILIDADYVDIEVQERTPDGWVHRRIADIAADLTLADPALSVPLATIYRRVSVTPEPTE